MYAKPVIHDACMYARNQYKTKKLTASLNLPDVTGDHAIKTHPSSWRRADRHIHHVRTLCDYCGSRCRCSRGTPRCNTTSAAPQCGGLVHRCSLDRYRVDRAEFHRRA